MSTLPSLPTLSAPPRTLRVEVWSDVACPWCYIGKRRFATALADFPHREHVEVVWRSFQLSPGTPSGPGRPEGDALAEMKGLRPDQVEQMFAHVTSVAAGEGLRYDFSRTLTFNTFDAHRLLHLAQEAGGPALVERTMEALFSAHFEQGVDLGADGALVALAAGAGFGEHGWDDARVAAVLADDDQAEAVRTDLDEARARRDWRPVLRRRPPLRRVGRAAGRGVHAAARGGVARGQPADDGGAGRRVRSGGLRLSAAPRGFANRPAGDGTVGRVGAMLQGVPRRGRTVRSSVVLAVLAVASCAGPGATGGPDASSGASSGASSTTSTGTSGQHLPDAGRPGSAAEREALDVVMDLVRGPLNAYHPQLRAFAEAAQGHGAALVGYVDDPDPDDDVLGTLAFRVVLPEREDDPWPPEQPERAEPHCFEVTLDRWGAVGRWDTTDAVRMVRCPAEGTTVTPPPDERPAAASNAREAAHEVLSGLPDVPPEPDAVAAAVTRLLDAPTGSRPHARVTASVEGRDVGVATGDADDCVLVARIDGEVVDVYPPDVYLQPGELGCTAGTALTEDLRPPH